MLLRALAPLPLLFAQDGASAPCAEELARFRGHLSALRMGDESVAEELRASADRLCASCARCDAQDVAAYYLALDPAAREQGRLDEQRYLALREEVVEASRAGLSDSHWAVERERILLGLESLASRARRNPDFVPAAQASSLLARLLIGRLERAQDLAPADSLRLSERAAEALETAHALFERAGQVAPRLEPLWLSGRLSAWSGRADEARGLFERCEGEARRLSNADFREHALRGQADLARDSGDATAVQRALAEIATFRDPEEDWPLACDWATLLLYSERPEQAADFLERCAPPEDAPRDDLAEWNLLMGGALLRAGELEDARPHLEAVAAAAADEMGTLALALLALRQGRDFEVEGLLGDERRLASFSARGQAEALALRAELAWKRGDLQRAIDELERGLALADAWTWRSSVRPLGAPGARPYDARGLAEGAAGSVIGEWLGLHAVALLADARARMGEPLEALRRIEDAQSRDLRAASEPMRELRALAGLEGPRPGLSPEDLEAWVRHAEAGLVSWVLGADFGVAVYAWDDGTSCRAVAARVERRRAEIADAARRAREALLRGDRTWLAREGAALARELLPDSLRGALGARLESLGAAAPEARLLLLLHGPLESLPIEALSLEPGGRALDSLATLLILPGLPAAQPGAPPDAGALASWRLLGAPIALDGAPLLRGAQQELRGLAQIRPEAALSLGPDFDRAHLEEALLSGACLHLSTHLLPRCAGEPRGVADVSFALSRGELACARDVAALEPSSPLAVLAACETGGGTFVDGKGLHGMARAFLQGGTRNVLATLFPVSDRAACAFSLAFHRALLDGLPPSRAARTARAELERQGFPLEDRAAFRLIGRD